MAIELGDNSAAIVPWRLRPGCGVDGVHRHGGRSKTTLIRHVSELAKPISNYLDAEARRDNLFDIIHGVADPRNHASARGLAEESRNSEHIVVSLNL